MKKPATCSLLGTVEVLLKFEAIIAVAIFIGVGPTSRDSKKNRDVNVRLWEGLRKVNLTTVKVE